MTESETHKAKEAVPITVLCKGPSWSVEAKLQLKVKQVNRVTSAKKSAIAIATYRAQRQSSTALASAEWEREFCWAFPSMKYWNQAICSMAPFQEFCFKASSRYNVLLTSVHPVVLLA